MKCAGYIRCSTNKQDLESQEHQLEEWAKHNKHTITYYKDYAISGRTSEREGISTLLNDAEQKQFEAVVVVELSRIGRSIGFIHTTIEKLNESGIKVILAQTNTELNSRSVEGVALLGGLALAAAVELKLIEERNRRGREKIKRDMIKCGRKRLEERQRNPLSISVVKTLREKGLSYRQIAKELNTSPPSIMRLLRRCSNAHISNVTESIQNNNKTEQKTGSVSLT